MDGQGAYDGLTVVESQHVVQQRIALAPRLSARHE